MRKNVRQVVVYVSTLLVFVALLDQLKRPEEERDWHGSVLGVPYDFRPPSFRRFQDAWWNPDDPRLFTPRDFGVGWAVNLHRLLEIASRPSKEDGDS